MRINASWLIKTWLVTLAVASMLIAGCGGGGGRGLHGDSVTLLLENDAGKPVNADWVVFQNGDGGWTRVEPSSTGTYVGTVTDKLGRYGFAYVKISDDVMMSADIARVIQTTMQESREWHDGIDSSGTVAPTACLWGKVEGTQSGFDIFCGWPKNEWEQNFYSDGIHYAYDLPSGNYDLLAVTGQPTDSMPSKMILLRGLAINGETQLDIDFNGAEVFVPEIHTVNIVGGTNPIAEVDWMGTNYYYGFNAGDNYDSHARSFQYAAIPAEMSLASDIYVLSASYRSGRNSVKKYSYFTSVSDKTINLNVAFFDSPTLTPAESGNGYIASWDAYPGAASYQIGYHNTWTTITAGRANTGKITFTWPDFSSVPGWSSDWDHFAETSSNWRISAWVGNIADLRRDGTEITIVSKAGDEIYLSSDRDEPALSRRMFRVP